MKFKLYIAVCTILAGLGIMLTPAFAAANSSKTPKDIGQIEARQELYRQRTWATNAQNALAKFAAVDKGAEEVMAYAHIAAASGRLKGWMDPLTLSYLEKVYSLQKPGGGWGLERSYDAFQDGTVNPASTVYTVTLADHVGKTFLEGYKAGVVADSMVQWIVDKLVDMPRVPVSQGQCVAYSDQAVDAKPGLCVHNVNAGVGAFLVSARNLGFTNAGMHDLIAGINTQESATYSWSSKFWPYRNGATALQDVDHNSYSAMSMYQMNRAVSSDSARYMMQNAWASDKLSPLAHMRLTAFPDKSLRAEGDKYFSSVASFIANPPSPVGNRAAQAAYFSALNIRGA